MATLNHIAMTKELLNVKMNSIKDCQEVIDEIDNEHPGGTVLDGGVRVWFAGQKEKFLKELNEKLEQLPLMQMHLLVLLFWYVEKDQRMPRKQHVEIL